MSRNECIYVESATAILVNCSLGRETYSKLRKILKNEGHEILPPWIHIRKEQSFISPKVETFPPPHKGVMLSYEESVKITARRILEDMSPIHIPNAAIMNIKFGFDGSGSHSMYSSSTM